MPFVDALTTMLDETIPLTIIEWEEWGNPKDPEFYHYMKSYSPVDNVKRQRWVLAHCTVCYAALCLTTPKCNIGLDGAEKWSNAILPGHSTLA